MQRSKKYDNISGLEGNNFVFEFKPIDGVLHLIGIYKDDAIMDPDNDPDWWPAAESREALSAYNIFKHGTAVEA